MKIGKRSTLAELDARGWGAFAADAGLGLPLIRRRVAEISEKVIARADKAAGALSDQRLDQAALERFRDLAVTRAQTCAPSFAGPWLFADRSQAWLVAPIARRSPHRFEPL